MSNISRLELRRLAVLIAIAACLSPQARGQASDTLWGLPLPGNQPQPLGIDLAAAGKLHGTLEFDRDGSVMYAVFGHPRGNPGRVVAARPEGRGLGTPFVRPEWTDFAISGFALSPDKQRLVLGVHLAEALYSEIPAYGMFLAHRTATGWTEPRLVESTYTAAHGSVYPSLASDGTLYFSGLGKREEGRRLRIHIAAVEPEDKGYGEAIPLTGGINDSDLHLDDPWVEPGERFMLLTGDAQDGWRDVYMSRRLPDGGWGPPESLAAQLGGNGDHFDRFPSLSPDGRLLFWVRVFGNSFPSPRTEYWWVSTDELGLPF